MPWIVNREYIIDTEFGVITCDVEIDITSDPIIVRFVQLDDTTEILAGVRDYIKNYLERAEDGRRLREEEREQAEFDRGEEDREAMLGDDEC